MVTESSPKKGDSRVRNDYIWLTNGKFSRPIEVKRDNNGENGSRVEAEVDEEIWGIVNELLAGAMSKCVDDDENKVVLRKKDRFNNNNHVFVRDKNSRRCISECVISENAAETFNPIFKTPEVPKTKSKRKHRLSFSSIFKKKVIPKIYEDKNDITSPEDEDVFESSEDSSERRDSLRMSQKFHSALEIGSSKSALHRTPSFMKRIISFGEESKSLLKRSISFRDMIKKDKSKEDLTKSKFEEWKQSLKSLTESDINVSYQDLSFVDYDIHNDISYDSSENIPKLSCVSRSQSVILKGTQKCRKPFFERGTSCTDPIELDCTESSVGVSLPYLPNVYQENAENSSETQILQKYRRRQQSISSSEDGGRFRPPGNGSFSSSGSGCSKLRRHNACRQKSRESCGFFVENRRNDSVRSRSLNHLDTLEMRQGIVSASDSTLKDSRSEPDCTRTLPPSSTAATDPVPAPQTCEVPQPRKHMLSRSQKSSSECFSVTFEVGDESTWENELFYPAQRGITLHDSLAKICELQNIDLSTCDARLQDKDNNSETFLSFSQDTAALVGRHIRITAKETSNKRLSGSIYGNQLRKKSESYKPRSGSFFSSSADETNHVASSTLSLHEGDQSKKQIKQMFTSFFANSKDSKYEGLIEQLDKYSKQGIPKSQYYQQGTDEALDALHKLEEDWRDIVEYKDLPEKQQQQQTVLWELIKTEIQYIKMLTVVTDLFLSCLRDLQSKNLLKEIDTEKLFSNITEILDANLIFWKNTLYPLVRDMRRYKHPACIENMLEGFSMLHETFQPYYKYCAEQSRCQHYCRENLDSEVFTAYLTWCESQKDCNRLRLMDILVQPMQRLTKYGLLLKAVLKNTEEDVEKENIQAMIKMVDDFVNNVNSSLKHKQDKERLKGIIARIESYDIVDSKDDDIEKLLKKDKTLTQFDLNRPMLNCPVERKRHLLLEGDLKLKDSGASKMEVHCFLLTDMLLICKPSTKKGGATMRVVRQPYLVDRLVVSELNKETPSLGLIYKNEFDMAVAAFILQNNDPKKIKGWRDGISKAQSLYAQARQMSYVDESLDADISIENLESDYHSLQLAPRSPLATSSRASRVSSLAHSHSGSVEMNDQSSIASMKDPSKPVSIDADRTGSISSDEGVQPLPPDKSPVSQKNSFKNRLFHKTPNTLSVQPFNSLGQSLPNLTLGSPNVGSMSLSLNQNTLSVPSNKNSSQLLSPTQRGISYPPPSPTRANLRRGLAISQNKNPPLIKTRHLSSSASCSQQIPSSNDFDVPVIAGASQSDDHCESFSRGYHRQAMKRSYRHDKRYYTAGVVDDIKKDRNRDASIHKRLSWNCNSLEQRPINEDHT
ncbi:pleckstrin homology domain-containing family G member 5 isoform X1 [Harmonia axyridis]|uniref:pleckstrin homology domain-containing family G member 5 isoform X1 n=1 Tax=Harmonia axyridis TaxID=115357 RepID=UPI001E275A16|nr:pleckstrin homology domain-containing family G member 5 isoform X1 [Harmonia axyridis]XP_045471613.1 pleckstrin homology domain-containing family G member 5 isoform X1 [Harmonia axyridis]XP_045471614.1 pleckstrin homology domain-containing family G member 5 isoform X1 [Harmonia axyridis]XP_045471615.1 pleckstrin homology domain-containing family G member 5 isoform X1 [Harmonia axyridis]XP_045471616.1 pleckstrin homology domain-containing family G member 5 isoform X1 [Harmonia axyridis]XP_04